VTYLGAVIHSAILDLLSQFNGICDDCGACCQDVSFALSPIEVPLLVSKLADMGLVDKHIRCNPHHFNRYTEFWFSYEEKCPFHENNRCSIYQNRPFICQLFPIELIAFIDNSALNFRTPFFAVKIGSSSYSCASRAKAFADEVGEVYANHKIHWAILLQIIAAITVENNAFAYLFGQPIARGLESFEPLGEWQELNNPKETKRFLDKHLFSIYKDPILLKTCWDDRLVKPSKAIVQRLLSRNYIRSVDRQLRNLIKRLNNSSTSSVKTRIHFRGKLFD
jgi:hypothetical protein